ncbi:uncharacterized protein BDW43DRAFT_274762 [Aspergillus alliaceus]|uniref:uncharacterized protein n=1 Tax=Petromyces alliaceus TaxID=209559 RepID=UPI0012A4229A|nr:uncharacterized protein BDW43DRAFT_274762 [Aspergillus alliaceus]KAB8233982.1 hypothetical protein BDW43DRAFT_274762 [Aspergillus alliaceus]
MVVRYHYDKTALQSITLQPISKLAPFSALIISIVLVVLFLVRYYVLEGFLIKRLYGSIYTNLSEVNQRGFINHHIAGITKLLILIVAAYPFIEVVIGKSSFHTPYAPGSQVKMGDMLVVVAQMLIGMYAFELIYRTKLSPIAVLHHVGTIMIGQSAIAISLDLAREPDADIEFVLCTVWGAFDIISEFFPHLAIILYRIFPDRHHFLKRLFLLSCITTAIGTTCETIVIFFLFGSLWDRWQLAFKVVTPLLHIAFSAAQVHGSVVFWKMYKRQERLLKEKSGLDIEREVSHESQVGIVATKAAAVSRSAAAMV